MLEWVYVRHVYVVVLLVFYCGAGLEAYALGEVGLLTFLEDEGFFLTDYEVVGLDLWGVVLMLNGFVVGLWDVLMACGSNIYLLL